jgi:nicotinate phosphoribosyltransferase
MVSCTSRQLDFLTEGNMGLLTDFYELTMCAAYYENHRNNEIATFDLFIRRLPRNRSYFVFAGLEQTMFYLARIKFTDEHIIYLKKQGFKQDFLDYLKSFRFTGEVCSVPEGTIVFPNEPLIRVTAPIVEAQIIETFLLNTINLQTMIATKASRIVHAANGRPIIEFGLRRTQGTDAGMKAARASYIAGCSGTSNVLAAKTYHIPVYGTMAHSYIMSYDTEQEAFRTFTRTFPQSTTLLIDTYDDDKGAENAATIAKELENKGHKINAVRIDSGNLLTISKKVRAILDKNRLNYVKIFASGDLDEYKIKHLLEDGAEIDAFGVGTRMSTSSDRPYVDVVYKLAGKVENDVFVPTMKLSKGKMTLPGLKQTFRQKTRDDMFSKDIIAIEDEAIQGEPLLKKVMQEGKIVTDLPTLEYIRDNALRNLAELPDRYRQLRNAAKFPVRLSPKLREILKQLRKQLRTNEQPAVSTE